MTSPSFAPARRAACAVTTPTSRATGWLVSPKGLFATSHATLGYQVEVELEHEAGDRRPGRVVWVDPGRDVALILADGLPRAPEPMAPLALREVPQVKSGDRVFTVAALAGRGLRIAPASVCAAPRPAGPEVIDLDAPLIGPAGGPLLDHDCRAVGLLVRVPGPSSPGAPSPGPVAAAASVSVPAGAPARRAAALPAAEIRAVLRILESAPDLPRRSPVYRCVACLTPFVPEHDACLACGVPLPHPYPPSASHASAERAVRETLAAIGVVANRVRTGSRSWHLVARGVPGAEAVPVELLLDEAFATAALRAPVAVAPRGPSESFYRLLLTLNDQTTGPFRLALSGERVVLLMALPVPMLRGRDLSPTLAAIGEQAEHFRKILAEGYDALPLSTLADPPEW